MSALKAQTTAESNFGHEMLDGEDAAIMVTGLKNRISITLEGAEIVRGTHDDLGPVTIVMPAAGKSSLLYPFENERDFCYKVL